jgi:hypothetical protein
LSDLKSLPAAGNQNEFCQQNTSETERKPRPRHRSITTGKTQARCIDRNMAMLGKTTFAIGSVRDEPCAHCARSRSARDRRNARRRTGFERTLGRLLLAAAMTSALACAAAPPARPTPASQPIDWQTSPLDLDLRGMNGERYAFTCPPGKPQPSRVAGSGPYTDDSSICTAAVHAGVIHAKDGGDVTIEIRPGQNTYPGSEQNYIASGSYDRAWSGGFIVIKTDAGTSRAASN